MDNLESLLKAQAEKDKKVFFRFLIFHFVLRLDFFEEPQESGYHTKIYRSRGVVCQISGPVPIDKDHGAKVEVQGARLHG